MDQETVASGALVGWARAPTENGTVLTIQIAQDRETFLANRLDIVRLALNDRQLRSLARDLERAARERGIELRPPPSLKMVIAQWLFGRRPAPAPAAAALPVRDF